jgi:hypothetical protein
MEKTLKLGDKDYRLHSSLFTIIDYRNVFSTELFSDIKKLEKTNIKKEDDISMYCIDLSANNPITTF